MADESLDPEEHVLVRRTRETDDLAPGTIIEGYRVDGRLGEGGMAVVYAATHPLIGKRAAIKVLRRTQHESLGAVERFLQEARIVNQIGHPNIVDIFDFGTLPDGRLFLVMEWLRGETLAAQLKRARMPLEDALKVLLPVGRALQASHACGVIHRDLKPDNVFLVHEKGRTSSVKLLDFGIAKLAGSEDVRLERTRTGSLVGTPLCLSPEQARGKNVDVRTDIYSLGVMGYQMICGRPPFLADNAADLVAMHLERTPPRPRELWPEIPDLLDQLLFRMLDKNPSQRPTLEEADRIFASMLSAPRSLERQRGRRFGWAIAVGLGVLGAAVLVDIAISRARNARRAVTTRMPPSSAAPAHTLDAAPKQSAIHVLNRAANAEVYLDGRLVARSSGNVRVMVDSPAEHVVEVIAEGQARFEERVRVASGVEIEIDARGRTSEITTSLPGAHERKRTSARPLDARRMEGAATLPGRVEPISSPTEKTPPLHIDPFARPVGAPR
jgi:serine/threonine-protein kinase